ncbi:MAG TPA: PspC domain-containing protein [Candidatus Methanomethylicus sp.]|nr:PspC domain-containing protein [Candidatus Methanomethylicus sp.]HRR54349.1 PspC domain-containing protein [Candidatus Methanomethylicus sp.]
MSGYGKRLYRSNDRILGGVCGGIAEYFGIDPSLVRIAWVILTLAAGSGILLYLLAWLIIPPSPYVTSPAPGGQAAPSSYSASHPTNSGLIVVAIIGVIILMAGLMSLAQRFFLFPFGIYILPLALVIVGVAVIAVAVMRRR